MATTPLFPVLTDYITACIQDFPQISAERKGILDQIASFVQKNVDEKKHSQLIYICTHNSRRSHYGQLWGATAAAYFGVPHVETFSGGTEATAFNPRAVAASQRAGFVITNTTPDTENPIYAVQFAENMPPLTAFSKKYDDAANPQANFCAVLTCNSADAACPTIFGAAKRVATPYEDPKAFDGLPEEAAMYDMRCRQIATENLYIFSQITTN